MKILKKLKLKIFKPKTIYEAMGQEPGLKSLVFNFYEVMENDPHAKECFEVHELENGKIPQEVKNKLFMFFSGWLGGPNLFQEKYGHPRMRARHVHIKITQKEADQWIYCMEKALEKNKSAKRVKQRFINSCKALTMRIINS